MDYYHVWCDLRDGVRDLAFCDNVNRYLGHLKAQGLVEGYRITRRKLGLAEFHFVVETRDIGNAGIAPETTE